MKILKKKINSVDIFEISGRLDVAGSRKFQEEIIPIIPKEGKVILDMSHCDYVASSGLRILLITAKQSALLGCKTVLVSVQPMVWDVILMTGFEDVLEAYSTREDALLALEVGGK